MFAYCLILTIMSGNFGFDGDDWWVLGWAYWHDFPSSILGYAKQFLRPVEGIYWISMFELFGFSRIAFHFASLTLLATSCLLMGKCLSKAFPSRSSFVALSTILAFFLPMISCLTYIVFTDNSRISLLLFWAAVLSFQLWAKKPSSWPRLVIPVCLYLLSFLTYEAPSFLIFVIPLLLWPIHKRNQAISDKWFLTVLGGAIFVSFTGAIICRYTFMSGGVVDAVGLTPSFQLIWSYFALLPFYLIAPFTFPPETLWVVLLGVMIAGWTIFVIYAPQERPTNGESPKQNDVSALPNETLYIVLLGVGILFLGMAPYQIAGYGSSAPKIVDTVLAKLGLLSDPHPAWFNFNEASRIYSSASYGVAFLIAVAATVWKRTIVRSAAQILVVITIGCMATFHAGLSLEWKEASVIRNKLIGSLVAKAPSVQNGTNFVFVDLELYFKRAAVIRGWSGLREFIRMLYNNPSLGAWYVYPSDTAWPNTSHQQAIVSPTGFISRGMDLDHPAQSDTLLIFRRQLANLLLLNNLLSNDDFIKSGISWQGCDDLRSNPTRIIDWCDITTNPRRSSKNPWNTGMISSLSLPAGSFFEAAP
ncbi:MAG: hypothetical protein ACLPVO_17350 [Desulfomonilaceae bacterium]